MAKEEISLAALKDFLPEGTFTYVISFFKQYNIHLTLVQERKSVLGDYRPPVRKGMPHRISVNVNLNQFHFLITLLHELAHLVTFSKYAMRAAPHGKEWKADFRDILIPMLQRKVLPDDVATALHNYLENPAASTCTDPGLYKALHNYNPKRKGWRFIDELAINARFLNDAGQEFEKVEQLRTRCRCRHVDSGTMYYFQGIVEVKVVAA